MTDFKFDHKMVTIHNPETPLSEQVLLACERGKFDNFDEYLKNNIVNINGKDSNGSTALHFAVAQNNVKCVDMLLRCNADPNIKDNDGSTPFALATGRYASCAVAETLMKNGANITSVNNWGNSALHAAVRAEDIHCVQLLLKHGADKQMKNKKGICPADLTDGCENSDIRSLIKSFTNSRCDHCNERAEGRNVLKTCTGCSSVQYCSKQCQKLAWKFGHQQICRGYVLTTFAVKEASAAEMRKLLKKKFIVKVQIPLTTESMRIETIAGDMMVYNRNKAFLHLLRSASQEKGFKLLTDKIKKNGFMGVKAYFWAEMDPKRNNRVKVFYQEPTVFQDW